MEPGRGKGSNPIAAGELEISHNGFIFGRGIDKNLDAFEVASSTGPGQTSTGFYFEQCIVRRTLYKCFVHIEELIWLPVQAGSNMRATVDVAVESPIFVDDKNVSGVFTELNVKPLAAGIFNFITVTKSYGQKFASESRFLMIFDHGFMREYNISSSKY